MPGFPRLALTYTANDLGDQIGLVALAILVFDQTGSALAVAALLVAARSIPALLAPLLSAALDGLAARVVFPALYSLEALAFTALVVLTHHFSLAVVLAIALIDGVLALSGRGLTRSTQALVLRPAGLIREGNNFVNVCFSVSNMVGPAIGGVVVAAGGPGWGLGIDAGLFALMAAWMALPGPWPMAHGERGGTWLARLQEGMRYVRSTPGVGSLIGAEAVALVPLTLVFPVLVIYAKQTLHAGDSGYGALQALWGVGVVVGSLVLLRIGHRSLRSIIGAGMVAIGIAYVGVGLAPDLAIALAVSVLGGIGNGVQSTTITTAVQVLVADEFMGRVSTLTESVAAGVMGIGFAIGGALAALLDPRVTYVIGGVGVLLSTPLLVRAVRSPS